MTNSYRYTGDVQETCTVSYTLGNSNPPAICTAAHYDAPVFNIYNDEDDCEEEHRETPSQFMSVQNACARLSRDMMSLNQSPEDLFDEAATTIAAGALEYTPPSALISILSKSRMAAAHIECAKKHNISFRVSDQITSAAYDADMKSIFYNPRMPVDALILAVSGELRRHWQDRQGALISPLLFAPEMALLIGRAQQADLMQMVVRTAWDLRLCGENAPWAYIESSTMADLGQAFAAEAFLDFRGLASGDAAIAVFEAWFLSPRCAQKDKMLIHCMLGGMSRPSHDLTQGMSLAVPDILRALGARPMDENYLAPHIGTLLEDPLFTEVRDRANANFLWFVRFEDCMRITENPNLRRDFRFAASAQRIEEEPSEQQGAEIIRFIPLENARDGAREYNEQGCEVIYLN